MTISDEELIFWEKKGISPEYMICDRFGCLEKSLDSKNQKMVNKMTNIRENKHELS